MLTRRRRCNSAALASWGSALLLGCMGLILSASADSVVADEKLPGFHKINQRISQVIRKVSIARSDDEVSQAVCDLVNVHRDLVSDPRFSRSDVLQGYRRRVAAKLRLAKKDIERELKKRELKKVVSLSEAKSPLADDLVSRVVSDQLSLVGTTLGGPARLVDEVTRRGGFAAAGVVDFGPALVQLIQSTISPKTWDVNGGPGTIIYYRPLFLMVVRAPLEAHEGVGEVLGALRK
ncbi:MAG: hypothetical protein VB878_10320 [Pirellulaceae bacterium]